MRSNCIKSNGTRLTLQLYFTRSSSSVSSALCERPSAIMLALRFPYVRAAYLPIPLDAPVISIFIPFKSKDTLIYSSKSDSWFV